MIFEKENLLKNDSLLKEVKALKLLENNLKKLEKNFIKIPNIYDFSKNIIRMEKVDTINPSSVQMEKLAFSLANLHLLRFNKYGLEYDNFIGLGVQKNVVYDNWGYFFYKYRLKSQVFIMTDTVLRNEFLLVLDRNKEKIVEFLNSSVSYASILHGDLWSGNVLFSKESIYLIDPAMYYGDSEVDIAMTEMFGGFSNSFYTTYNLHNPLSKEYEKKKILYNLYHYLNHYNLFGISYLNNVHSGFDFIKKL